MISVLSNLPRLAWWPGVRSALVNIPCTLEKNACSALVTQRAFYKCQWGQLDDSVVQIFYVFTDFLSTWSINYWEKGAETSSSNCEFDYFSIQFYQFCLMSFKALLLGVLIFMHLTFMHLMLCAWCCPSVNWPLYHFEVTLFIPANILCSEIYFIWY